MSPIDYFSLSTCWWNVRTYRYRIYLSVRFKLNLLRNIWNTHNNNLKEISIIRTEAFMSAWRIKFLVKLMRDHSISHWPSQTSDPCIKMHTFEDPRKKIVPYKGTSMKKHTFCSFDIGMSFSHRKIGIYRQGLYLLWGQICHLQQSVENKWWFQKTFFSCFCFVFVGVRADLHSLDTFILKMEMRQGIRITRNTCRYECELLVHFSCFLWDLTQSQKYTTGKTGRDFTVLFLPWEPQEFCTPYCCTMLWYQYLNLKPLSNLHYLIFL